MKKDVPNLNGFSKDELISTIKLGIAVKKNPELYSDKLKNKTMAMWFEKPSLRTRVSFEAGMTQLGGHAIYLDASTTHKKADIKDETKCLSSFADVIISRVFEYKTIKEMIAASEVPVINALCNKYHPCQALADMMTLFEVFEEPHKIKIAYVGDGNNVCNSLITAAKKLGICIHVATPPDLKPESKPDFWTEDPHKAVEGADVVYTDTWVSMGKEDMKDKLIAKLKKYSVDKELIKDKYLMHCLPAIRGQEVADEVIDSDKSLVFQQAENRLHAQKALLIGIVK